jgi:hypothetical protein
MILCLPLVFEVFRCSSARRSSLVAERAGTPIFQGGVPRKETGVSKKFWNTSGTPLEHLHIKLKIGFNRGWNTWNTWNTSWARARVRDQRMFTREEPLNLRRLVLLLLCLA